MEFTKKPRLDLARKYLPQTLYRCIEYIFSQDLEGVALCGGTALAGFYAAHRRSDDIDIFTRDKDCQLSTVLAVKSLKDIGVKFNKEFSSAHYYKAVCFLDNHNFTIDVVHDPNFFNVGEFEKLDNIVVANLKTILMTKAATLVSRCSEKDIYDLIWIFNNISEIGFEEFISLGQKIDAGLSGESLFISISETILKEGACNFSIRGRSGKEIFEEIESFRKDFLKNLSLYLKKQPVPPLGKLVKKLQKFKL